MRRACTPTVRDREGTPLWTALRRPTTRSPSKSVSSDALWHLGIVRSDLISVGPSQLLALPSCSLGLTLRRRFGTCAASSTTLGTASRSTSSRASPIDLFASIQHSAPVLTYTRGVGSWACISQHSQFAKCSWFALISADRNKQPLGGSEIRDQATGHPKPLGSRELRRDGAVLSRSGQAELIVG